MKKILFTIALTITLGLTATAQKDGFFSNWDDDYRNICVAFIFDFDIISVE